MFVTNWISTTKIQKISEIINFFRHYFLSRTEVIATPTPSSSVVAMMIMACQSCSLSISKLKLEIGQSQMQQKSTSTNNPIILKKNTGQEHHLLARYCFITQMR